MGAVSINRKRKEESFNLSHQQQSISPYTQASKKRRFSSIIMSESSSIKPTISRIPKYPDAKAPLKREIHAPSRGILRYGSLLPKPNNDCGNSFVRNYDNAKRTALDSLRFVRKDKEIIDVDDDDEIVYDVIDCDKEEKNIDDSSTRPVDDTSLMLDSLSLDRQVRTTTTDASSLEAYRKLMQSAERRNSKLEALGFEILLTEKKLFNQRLSRPKPVEKQEIIDEVPREPFIPLTEEEEAEVYRAFSGRNRRKVLATHGNSNIDITGEVLQCLTPGAWLNDEVINVYLELLKERETSEPKKYLKCHFFNTFFYKKLVGDSGYNFKAVKRWTTQRKLGYALIDCDMIFVPIHRGVHWTLAVINNRDCKFLYLDSLNGSDPVILNALAKYLVEEAKEKSGENIDVSSWDMEFVDGLPQQQNGYDCGMFMLKYIDFFSRGLGLCFSQEHMPYFRLRTAKEILRLKAG